MYEYQAEITKIVDGDTVHARVDLGCDVRINLTLRLAGINAPELSTVDGKLARDALVGALAGVTKVVVKTEKDRREKYGRYLATILLPDGTKFLPPGCNINKWMIDNGHAVAYFGA